MCYRDAIHKRIRRNTIRHERGEDGRLYVYVDTSTSGLDMSTDASKTEVTERYIARLERQLEEADARDRENRRIIALLTPRIPAIEAPSVAEESPQSTEPRPGTPTEASGGTQETTERPWWRFW